MKRIGFPWIPTIFPQFSYGFWIAQGAGSPMPGGGAGRVPSPLFAMGGSAAAKRWSRSGHGER